MPHKTYTVGVFIGSLSKNSLNRRLAKAIEKLAEGTELDLVEIPIDRLPLYNRDVDANYPPEGRAFKEAVEQVDALIFVTPEYNRSIPGALKNAIDWGSRPYGTNSFARKPAAIIGTSTGAIGTAVGQSHLRSILSFVDAPQMTQPEAYIQYKEGLIADDGTVTNESTREFLRKWIASFEVFVEKVTSVNRPAEV